MADTIAVNGIQTGQTQGASGCLSVGKWSYGHEVGSGSGVVAQICEPAHPEARRSTSEFRIFDPAMAHQKGIAVKNWTSLDDLPDLILYSGQYDKSANSIEIH
jgi:hypothetical protein